MTTKTSSGKARSPDAPQTLDPRTARRSVPINMIQLNKNYSLPERLAEFIPIKRVAGDGAGLNAVDRLVLDGLERADVVAINTDGHSLTSSVATRKVQLGRSVSRGLGAGGDPDVGYQAALESADEIRETLADTDVIFVCAGLGGGTGLGAAPYLAQADF